MLDDKRVIGRHCVVHTDHTKTNAVYTGICLGSNRYGVVVEREDGSVEVAYPNFVRFTEAPVPAMDASLAKVLRVVGNGDVCAVAATLLREAADLGLVAVVDGEYALTDLGRQALL